MTGHRSRPALVEAVSAGIARAADAIDSGAAAALLDRWVATTAELAG